MSESDTFQNRSEKEIFFEALDKETPGERAAFLDGACGRNAARRARVEALLDNHFAQDSFMKEPAAREERPRLESVPHLHSHKLIREKDRSKTEWTLEWDESVFRLRSPDGQTALETSSAQAYRLIELQNLYNCQRVSLVTPHGSLVFKPQKAAVAEVRRLVESGLRSDLDYRQQIKSRCRVLTRLGLGMFLGGGIPFVLFSWWASRAPNPPPALFQWVGPFIHLASLLLLGAFAAGLGVTWFALTQQMRIRRIEKDFSSQQ